MQFWGVSQWWLCGGARLSLVQENVGECNLWKKDEGWLFVSDFFMIGAHCELLFTWMEDNVSHVGPYSVFSHYSNVIDCKRISN